MVPSKYMQLVAYVIMALMSLTTTMAYAEEVGVKTFVPREYIQYLDEYALKINVYDNSTNPFFKYGDRHSDLTGANVTMNIIKNGKVIDSDSCKTNWYGYCAVTSLASTNTHKFYHENQNYLVELTIQYEDEVVEQRHSFKVIRGSHR